MFKFLKFSILFISLIQMVEAGRYYDNEHGRFIQRDPLGYVDGMSLYNAYFAEGFGLDPSGYKTKKTSISKLYKKHGKDYKKVVEAIIEDMNIKFCDVTLCKAIELFIQQLADRTDDYDDFQEYLHWHSFATLAQKALAKKYKDETGCDDKGKDGQWSVDKTVRVEKDDYCLLDEKGNPKFFIDCCHGFTDQMKHNGADNLRHYGGVLYWGSLAARFRNKFSDVPEPGDSPRRKREVESERRSNSESRKASKRIEKELGKHAGLLMEDEQSDYAWDQVRDIPAAQWKARFCK